MSTTRQHETDSSADEQGVGLVDEAEQAPEVLPAVDTRVQELEARLRTVSAAYKEKADEIERTKERLSRQAHAQEEIRRGEVVSSVFEPVENLHRAIAQLRTSAPDSAHGLEMVHQQFMQALHKLGLEEIATVGTRFDPSVHEAIASQPVAEAAQDNTVVQVFSLGYRIGTRVIRPARVVIGAYTEPAADA
jgi:molecular chaperone GrpE